MRRFSFKATKISRDISDTFTVNLSKSRILGDALGGKLYRLSSTGLTQRHSATSGWCSIFSVLFLLKAGCVCMCVFTWVCACGPCGFKKKEKKKVLLRWETKESALYAGPVSHCGKSLAAAQVSEVRAVRLGCSPGPTSLPAFQEITAGTEKRLPLPRHSGTTERARAHTVTQHTHTHTLRETRERVQK